jgi:hypothetical protein
MLQFKSLDARISLDDALGFIPMFLVESDPRPAVEQINERYAHGGGWHDLKVGDKGFRMIGEDKMLKYPGDVPMTRVAVGVLHGEEHNFGNLPMEVIHVYRGGYLAIEQNDGSFRVSRLD